ncbi:acyltransferase family protein [Leuconostoc rapi]|uniref:acyltransferase family protein n=1 Tax=Leuconostoc rapi TaxID=1406906 RepID=UPI0019586565|nr:acyltransferase [Leuconostoc rapi]MBM7436281.1 fucose 4-O-acetylase-like acetyltransferase [Leuconostoc rapi]
MIKKRILWLDLAKGLTIFLVVLVHVVEGIYKTNQFQQYNWFSEMILGLLFTIVMPVFFALSGYVYKPVSTSTLLIKNLVQKFVNLGIPYVIFSVIYVSLQHVGSEVHQLSTWQDLGRIYVVPIGYLWYLYVLFFIYVLVGIMYLLKVPTILQIGIYSILLLLNLGHVIIMPYVFDSLCMWTIIFYLGYLFKEKPAVLNRKSLFIFNLVAFSVGMIWQVHTGKPWYDTNMMTQTDFMAKLASVPLFLYLFSHIKIGRVGHYFIKYGRHSLVIYLIHAPVASIVRVLLLRLGVQNYFLLIVLTLIFAWTISLCTVCIAHKVKWVDMIFNPYQYLEKIKLF